MMKYGVDDLVEVSRKHESQSYCVLSHPKSLPELQKEICREFLVLATSVSSLLEVVVMLAFIFRRLVHLEAAVTVEEDDQTQVNCKE